MPLLYFPRLSSCSGRLAVLAMLAMPMALAAQSAACQSLVNFWLSNNSAAGPEAPVIYAPVGHAAELQVWARPASGYNLSAFSLNLVADQAGIVTFDSVSVLNPVIDGGPALRHQLVFDSSTGLHPDVDGIRGIVGLSFFSGGSDLAPGTGIGPSCGGDPDCCTAAGEPAWHIASIVFQAESYGTVDLFLEIGTQGLWQSPAMATEPDPPTDAAAVFGAPDDVVHTWGDDPGPDLRHMHLGLPDAVVVAANADFDEDGDVDGADVLIWQRGFGAGSLPTEGDADRNNEVNGADLAAWRYQFGMTLAGENALAVPEVLSWQALLALCSALSLLRKRVTLGGFREARG